MCELKWGNEYRTTLLCVDGYDDKTFQGRFYHLIRPEGEVFHSLGQYLLKMEDLLNEMDRPQADTQARTFGPCAQLKSEKLDISMEKTGALATFQVRVLFRHHASWQGEVVWSEKGAVQRFRSVLELIRLLDSALCAKKKT